MFMIGSPVIPRVFKIRCPDIMPPNAVPQYAASIVFLGIFESSIAALTAGQAISESVFPGYFPKGTIPAPNIATRRINSSPLPAKMNNFQSVSHLHPVQQLPYKL